MYCFVHRLYITPITAKNMLQKDKKNLLTIRKSTYLSFTIPLVVKEIHYKYMSLHEVYTSNEFLHLRLNLVQNSYPFCIFDIKLLKTVFAYQINSPFGIPFKIVELFQHMKMSCLFFKHKPKNELMNESKSKRNTFDIFKRSISSIATEWGLKQITEMKMKPLIIYCLLRYVF